MKCQEFAVVVVVFLCLCSLSWGAHAAQSSGNGSASAEWASWRGPNQDSISPESDLDMAKPTNGPAILWQTNVGVGWSTVAIKGDRLYIMGNRTNLDNVICLKVSDGSEIWRHSYPCHEGKDGYPGPRATPTVDDYGVYTLSRDGQVFCLDPASGAVKWQANLPKDYQARSPGWGFASSALLTGDLVLWNANSNGIALNRKTGKKVWASPPGVGNYAVPVLYKAHGIQCAAIFNEQELCGVEVASGRRLWTITWKRDHNIMAAEPIVSGDHIFVTSGYGRGCALYKLGDNEPQPVWKTNVMSCFMTSPVLFNGHVYGADGNARARVGLKCIDFMTGEQKWVRDWMDYFQIMVAGGKLVMLTEKGELIIAAAQPDSYEELARVKIFKGGNQCWIMPVLCNGRIYCRTPQGDLAVVDVRRQAGEAPRELEGKK